MNHERLKWFQVRVELRASNTFRYQARNQGRAEQIALDTAKGDAKKLQSLRWKVDLRVADGKTGKKRK